jgi:hypothetical protein
VVSTGLSQPVSSIQLCELEKNIDITFCLIGRGVTYEDHTVYTYANELQKLLTNYAYKLKGGRSKSTGHVRIGCLDNTATLKNNPLPKEIEAFYQLSDSVEVTLEVGDFIQLNEKLSKNKLDTMIVVLALQEKNFSWEKQRINIGAYSAETMYQLLEIEKINNIKLFDGWHAESGMLLVLAGTYLSFLTTHLIDNNQYQHQVVALQPKKWHFYSQFSLVLKNYKCSLSPASLAFHDCLMNPENA